MFGLFDRVELLALLALPTLPMFPPRIDGLDAESLMPTVVGITAHVPSTQRGTPCTVQPVPVRGSPLPASLQLVGPLGAEELLLTSARRVEDEAQALRSRRPGPAFCAVATHRVPAR